MILLRRKKSCEDRNVHLWFQDDAADNIVSLVGSTGDVRTRISVGGEHHELGHPFTDPNSVKDEEDSFGALDNYVKSINVFFQRQNINAKVNL